MPSLPSASRERALAVAAGAVAVLCGVGIAVQSRLNSGLVVLLVAVTALPSGRAGVRALVAAVRDRTVPVRSLLGGAVGAFFVFSQGFAAGLVGVALFTIAYVAGQSVGGVVIDRIGVAGLSPKRITAPRILGAALALLAVAVASWGRIGDGGAPAWVYLLPIVAGIGSGWQQACNGLVRHVARSALVATALNFVVGTLLLVLAWAVVLVVEGLPRGEVRSPVLLTGGIVGLAFIFGMAVIVRRLGVLVLTLGAIAGQLAAAVALDAWVPAAGHRLEPATVVGSVVALGAVVVAALPGLRRRARPAPLVE